MWTVGPLALGVSRWERVGVKLTRLCSRGHNLIALGTGAVCVFSTWWGGRRFPQCTKVEEKTQKLTLHFRQLKKCGTLYLISSRYVLFQQG